MSAPDIILKLSNIESYYGPIMAIRGISIEVPRGQIVTLLGANGAGKTTVLKTISGILDPQKGSIEFLGKPIQRMEADKIVRLGLSHVPAGREVTIHPIPRCSLYGTLRRTSVNCPLAWKAPQVNRRPLSVRYIS